MPKRRDCTSAGDDVSEDRLGEAVLTFVNRGLARSCEAGTNVEPRLSLFSGSGHVEGRSPANTTTTFESPSQALNLLLLPVSKFWGFQ